MEIITLLNNQHKSLTYLESATLSVCWHQWVDADRMENTSLHGHECFEYALPRMTTSQQSLRQNLMWKLTSTNGSQCCESTDALQHNLFCWQRLQVSCILLQKVTDLINQQLLQWSTRSACQRYGMGCKKQWLQSWILAIAKFCQRS